MSKSSTEMLIEAGVIPKNAVQQMEKWRIVEEGTVDKVGSRAVSLEQDSEAARRFAERLSEQLEKEEAAIKETDLSVVGGFRQVYLQWSSKQLDDIPTEAVVDRMGRIYFPARLFGNGLRRKIKAVSFTGSPADAKAVLSSEPRYEGDMITTIVCTLEE